MFACFFAPQIDSDQYGKLIDFASQFSPLLEETTSDSVIADLRGSELLNGPASGFPLRASELASETGIEISTAVASNPDAAFHAVHGFKKPFFIEPGSEAQSLSSLPLEIISAKLASVSPERIHEIIATLKLWGIYNFGQLAALPPNGIAERLGPEGLKIQQLASGKGMRSIAVRHPDPVFCRSADLESPIVLKEPLLLLLSSLLEELQKELNARHLAAHGIKIQLKLVDGSTYQRKIEFPASIKDCRTLEKILDLEISAFPPEKGIAGAKIWLGPGVFQAVQSGLFTPGGPEPEKTEMVLARIGKMVGPVNIGSPEVENSHRPDPFRMRQFHPDLNWKNRSAANPARPHGPAYRMLRPPLKASVWTNQNQPIRLHAPDSGIRKGISGYVIVAAGPWKTSGNWWSEKKWAREEWDLQISDGAVCRVYRDLLQNSWFVDGIYD